MTNHEDCTWYGLHTINVQSSPKTRKVTSLLLRKCDTPYRAMHSICNSVILQYVYDDAIRSNKGGAEVDGELPKQSGRKYVETPVNGQPSRYRFTILYTVNL
jgi:hypothetical protein